MHDAHKMRRVLCLVLLCLLFSSGVDAFGFFNKGGENHGFWFFGWRGRKETHEEAPSHDVDPFKKAAVAAPVQETHETPSEEESHRAESDLFSLGSEMLDGDISEEETELSGDVRLVTPGESEMQETETLPLWMDVQTSTGASEDESITGGVTKEGTTWKIDLDSLETQKPEESTEGSQVDTDMMGMRPSRPTLGKTQPHLTEHSSEVPSAERTVEISQQTAGHFPYASRVEDATTASKQFETPMKSTTRTSVAVEEEPQMDPKETPESTVEEKAFEIMKWSVEEARGGVHPEVDPTHPVIKAPVEHNETQIKPDEATPALLKEKASEQKNETTKVITTEEPETSDTPKPETEETGDSVKPEKITEPKVDEKTLIVTEEGRTKITSPGDFLTYMKKMGIEDTEIQTNVETPEGKVAILINAHPKMKLEKLQFEAVEDAAVILKIVGGELELRDVVFAGASDVKTPRRYLSQEVLLKTGLMIDGGAVVFIADSTFESATDTMIRVLDGSNLKCNQCTFNNNEGSDGGAVSVKDSSARFDGCHMKSNKAKSSGGAIHFEGSSCDNGPETSLKIHGTTFKENKATHSGASIFVNCAKEAKISGSEFQSEFANDGGAAYIKNINTLKIDDSTFLKNGADGSGGCLFVEDAGVVSVIGSVFKDNSAVSTVGGAGHIARSVDTTFRNCTFTKNDAPEGGALSIVEPHSAYGILYIQHSYFDHNKAAGKGGAVLVQRASEQYSSEAQEIESAYVKIERSYFSYNSAGEGGGVYVTSDSSESDYNLMIRVSATNFTQNTADVMGGGVYCGNHATMDVAFSRFVGNTATTATNAAKQCGCNMNLENSVTSFEGSVSNAEVTDVCGSGDSVGGTNHKKTKAVVYVFIALGAICVFSAMAVAAILRKRRSVNQSNLNSSIHRSLSRFVGPDRTQSILSVSFLPEEGYDDDELGRGHSLLRSQTLGEMDYYVREGNEIHAESLDHDVIADREERATLQQTISADDAFFDSLKWDQSEPTPIRRLASIPEIASHPTDEKFSP